jgi:flagellin-like hook-associated protein FlgL
MKSGENGMRKLFAVSAYTRALGGDFTGKRRVSASAVDVSNRVIQVDAALRGILASLRSMKAVCEALYRGDASPGERAERGRELDSLKGNISRLSKQIAGTEFLMTGTNEADSENELRSIDESIEKISKFYEPDTAPDDKKLADWMKDLFGT